MTFLGHSFQLAVNFAHVHVHVHRTILYDSILRALSRAEKNESWQLARLSGRIKLEFTFDSRPGKKWNVVNRFYDSFDETAAKEPPEGAHQRTPGADKPVGHFCSSLTTLLLATCTSLIFNGGGVKRCAQLQPSQTIRWQWGSGRSWPLIENHVQETSSMSNTWSRYTRLSPSLLHGIIIARGGGVPGSRLQIRLTSSSKCDQIWENPPYGIFRL